MAALAGKKKKRDANKRERNNLLPRLKPPVVKFLRLRWGRESNGKKKKRKESLINIPSLSVARVIGSSPSSSSLEENRRKNPFEFWANSLHQSPGDSDRMTECCCWPRHTHQCLGVIVSYRLIGFSFLCSSLFLFNVFSSSIALCNLRSRAPHLHNHERAI